VVGMVGLSLRAARRARSHGNRARAHCCSASDQYVSARRRDGCDAFSGCHPFGDAIASAPNGDGHRRDSSRLGDVLAVALHGHCHCGGLADCDPIAAAPNGDCHLDTVGHAIAGADPRHCVAHPGPHDQALDDTPAHALEVHCARVEPGISHTG
jgi:hypothetical protein